MHFSVVLKFASHDVLYKSVVSTNSTIRALLNLVGNMGLEPTRLSTLESKSSAATNYANPPFKSWSEYKDLNLGPHAPKASALPD